VFLSFIIGTSFGLFRFCHRYDFRKILHDKGMDYKSFLVGKKIRRTSEVVAGRRRFST